MSIVDWIIFGLSIISFGIGGFFMVHQVFFGLDKTGLNHRYVWGVNIQGFYFLSAVGVGILVLSAIGLLAYPKADLEILKVAGSIGFGALIGAQLLMGADLGKPFRAWRILIGKKILSPLTLDFLVLALLSLCGFVLMFSIFMTCPLIVKLWAWATLALGGMAMVIHTLLFVSRVGAGYKSEPFASSINIVSGIWIGSGVLRLMFYNQSSEIVSIGFLGTFDFFSIIFVISSLLALVCGLGSIILDLFTEEKPHNLIFTGVALVVSGILFLEGTVIYPSKLLAIILVVLVLIGVYIEKHQTVLNLQAKPVLPEPYSTYEKKVFYKPVISEWLNLLAGVGLTVFIMYVVKILNTWVIPWLISLLF